MNRIVKVMTMFAAGYLAEINSQAALVITGQCFDTASMGLEDGTNLNSGVVKMGYYTVIPTSITFNGYTSASQFETNFVTMSSNAMGIDSFNSLFSTTLEVATGISTYQGKQVFLLVGNGSLLSNSSQIGVFTRSSWIVPTNPTGPTPDPVSFEMSSVLPSDILFGSYSSTGGAYPSDGVTGEYRLQTVVPEPSTGALLMIGSVGLVALRRLRKV